MQEQSVDRPAAQEAFGIQARNLARLSAEGVTIGFGTDGGTGWSPHAEMEDMVRAGMSPADVLVAATGNSAALLALDDVGTLEAGKSADFVVFEANHSTTSRTRDGSSTCIYGVSGSIGRV